MNKKIITLTGFMGSGKTFVSGILAREIGYTLVDSDAEIEKRQGKKISDIIKEQGESAFRQIETDVLQEILSQDFVVLSVGGGAIMHNANLIMGKSAVVFLDTDFDLCYKRIKDDTCRPLAYGKSKQEVFDLYNKRLPTYQQNCHLAVNHVDGQQTVKQIKQFLQL